MKQATNTFVYFNLTIFYEENIMPWLKQLFFGLSLQRHGFNPKAAHVKFVVDIVSLGQGSSKYFSFPVRSVLVSIHTHTVLHSPTISTIQS